jgi:hypothetical protein
MMACALVPLTPNAETPARRGRPFGATAPPRSAAAPPGRPVHVRGRLVRVQGRRQFPCRSASTILITPATPPRLAWPMFDFTDPSHSGRSFRSRSCP